MCLNLMAASTLHPTEFSNRVLREQNVKEAANTFFENSNDVQTSIGPKSIKYSRLRPVRAVQLLSLYPDSSIFAVCEDLEKNGLPIIVDNLLDRLHGSHLRDSAAKDTACGRNSNDERTNTLTHSVPGGAHNKLLATNHQQGPATRNLDERIKSHSATKNPKFDDTQQCKRLVKNGCCDDQPLLENKVDVQVLTEAQRLEAENKKIRESRMCSKCKERQADIILLPCRHISVCHSCWNPQKKIPCPKCNMGVAGSFHVFWG